MNALKNNMIILIILRIIILLLQKYLKFLDKITLMKTQNIELDVIVLKDIKHMFLVKGG